MTFFLALPVAALLYFAQDALSDLHPVSVILSGGMEYSRRISPSFALYVTALFYGLALLLTLFAGAWGVWRKQSPIATLFVALRRLALPLSSVLLFVYLVLMNQTLSYDAAATRAINEAAEHDLHWVLTHSGTSDEAEDE
jgi:hypothetical protein